MASALHVLASNCHLQTRRRRGQGNSGWLMLCNSRVSHEALTITKKMKRSGDFLYKYGTWPDLTIPYRVLLFRHSTSGIQQFYAASSHIPLARLAATSSNQGLSESPFTNGNIQASK